MSFSRLEASLAPNISLDSKLKAPCSIFLSSSFYSHLPVPCSTYMTSRILNKRNGLLCFKTSIHSTWVQAFTFLKSDFNFFPAPCILSLSWRCAQYSSLSLSPTLSFQWKVSCCKMKVLSLRKYHCEKSIFTFVFHGMLAKWSRIRFHLKLEKPSEKSLEHLDHSASIFLEPNPNTTCASTLILR